MLPECELQKLSDIGNHFAGFDKYKEWDVLAAHRNSHPVIDGENLTWLFCRRYYFCVIFLLKTKAMDTKKATKEATRKQKKTQARLTIALELDHLLGKYKNGTDKKKYEKGLKKASKALSKVVVVPAPKKVQPKKSTAKAVATAQ